MFSVKLLPVASISICEKGSFMWVKCIDYGAFDVYMDNDVVFGLAIIKLEFFLKKT